MGRCGVWKFAKGVEAKSQMGRTIIGMLLPESTLG